MHTPICDELNIEFPIFAFTHCRDVVVAVSKAGGFGVLGAVASRRNNWRSSLPGSTRTSATIRTASTSSSRTSTRDGCDLSPEVLKKTLNDLVPQEHIDFAKQLLAAHGVPVDHSDDDALQLLGWTEATATPQVEVALKHPSAR